MPKCVQCFIVAATVELRRLPNKQEYVCKDKYDCEQRKKARLKAEREPV